MAAAVLLAACGGGDPTSVTAGGGTSTSAAETAAAAQRVVLRTIDLPGFQADPPVKVDTSGTKAASSFQACAGAAAALGDVDRAAASPGFYKDGTTMVASIAVVSHDDTSAKRALADLSRQEVATCLTTLFKDVLALHQVLGATTSTERLPASEVSADSVTWRTTITATGPQGTAIVFSDLTLFRNGRTVAALFNVQGGTPFPSAERQRLLKSMIERMD